MPCERTNQTGRCCCLAQRCVDSSHRSLNTLSDRPVVSHSTSSDCFSALRMPRRALSENRFQTASVPPSRSMAWARRGIVTAPRRLLAIPSVQALPCSEFGQTRRRRRRCLAKSAQTVATSSGVTSAPTSPPEPPSLWERLLDDIKVTYTLRDHRQDDVAPRRPHVEAARVYPSIHRAYHVDPFRRVG